MDGQPRSPDEPKPLEALDGGSLTFLKLIEISEGPGCWANHWRETISEFGALKSTRQESLPTNLAPSNIMHLDLVGYLRSSHKSR